MTNYFVSSPFASSKKRIELGAFYDADAAIRLAIDSRRLLREGFESIITADITVFAEDAEIAHLTVQ